MFLTIGHNPGFAFRKPVQKSLPRAGTGLPDFRAIWRYFNRWGFRMNKAIALAALLSMTGAAANAASVLINGDFESGAVGFTSDYVETASNGTAGEYAITTLASSWNGAFANLSDHTSGSGNMMALNGGTTAGAVVWSQTVNVVANTEYEFSGWIAGLFGSANTIALEIGTDNLGSVSTTTSSVWENFGFTWFSGANTSITISLLQVSTAFLGNDYALDDLSFTAKGVSPIPLPAGLPLLLAGLGGLALLRRRGA